MLGHFNLVMTAKQHYIIFDGLKLNPSINLFISVSILAATRLSMISKPGEGRYGFITSQSYQVWIQRLRRRWRVLYPPRSLRLHKYTLV
jgi:hypothetical protein